MTRALITGIAGQDGSYLAELLLAKGYEVHGTVRPGGSANPVSAVTVHEVDIADGCSELIRLVRPHEIYNLAALSSVSRSFTEPEETLRVNGTAVATMLDTVEELAADGAPMRFVQASSAEIFGAADHVPQDEDTPLRPVSPYGHAKALAQERVATARQRGIFASSCILYSHESPRRPPSFVTRKITMAVAQIASGANVRLELGDLSARRDWGWAPDYVRALHAAATAERPDDFIIATGVSHSVADFALMAFAHAGISDWRRHVDLSPGLLRATDPPEQRGNPARAAQVLGWKPEKQLADIVTAMVDSDLRRSEPSS